MFKFFFVYKQLNRWKIIIMSFSSLENTHIQKLYPTVNNDDLLEFRIPPSVKGNMLLSDVLLRFQVTIPQMDESEVVP